MRRGSQLLFGIVLFGVFFWEILSEGNARRWQVWSILPAATIWTYVGIKKMLGVNLLIQPGDPSWWWLLTLVFCPLSLLPYAIFRVHERMEGR